MSKYNCNYQDCSFSCKKLQYFQNHINCEHINAPYKCVFENCHFSTRSRKLFKMHYKSNHICNYILVDKNTKNGMIFKKCDKLKIKNSPAKKYICNLSKHQHGTGSVPGGLSHSLTDYITAYCISKILNIEFINTVLITGEEKRDMLVDNSDIYFWNNYLGLSNNESALLEDDCVLKPIECDYYQNLDLSKLDIITDSSEQNDTIYYINNSGRIGLYDLYKYEKEGKIEKGILEGIIHTLRKLYYSKNINEKNKKKIIINCYLRRGDLYHKLSRRIDEKDLDFQLNILQIIYDKYFEQSGNLEFNVISAGTFSEMEDIKIKYSHMKNINYYLNSTQEVVFTLLASSDVMIYTWSGFPFTCSLYSDGLIVKKQYYGKQYLSYNPEFLDNYMYYEGDVNINNKHMIDILQYIDDKLKTVT